MTTDHVANAMQLGVMGRPRKREASSIASVLWVSDIGKYQVRIRSSATILQKLGNAPTGSCGGLITIDK